MSICRGIDAIHKRCLRNADSHYRAIDIHALLSDMLAQIEQNWQASPRRLSGMRPSRENWRLEKRLHIASHNASPEKTLEKAVARFDGWYNQIPTASGLFNQHSDKLRNIDLARQTAASSYAFVELKVASNTPIYAAMESLLYAALYFFALRNYTEDERASKALLQADALQWLVLAPLPYYVGGTDYVDLGERIAEGLQRFASSLGVRCTMDFGFRAFPDTFTWPCEEGLLRQAVVQMHPVTR